MRIGSVWLLANDAHRAIDGSGRPNLVKKGPPRKVISARNGGAERRHQAYANNHNIPDIQNGRGGASGPENTDFRRQVLPLLGIQV